MIILLNVFSFFKFSVMNVNYLKIKGKKVFFVRGIGASLSNHTFFAELLVLI